MVIFSFIFCVLGSVLLCIAAGRCSLSIVGWFTTEMVSLFYLLVTMDGFSTHRVDGHGGRSGGILTYICNDWVQSVERVFTYSTDSTNCLGLRCTPNKLFYGKSIVIVNFYVPLATTYAALSGLLDALTQNIGPI